MRLLLSPEQSASPIEANEADVPTVASCKESTTTAASRLDRMIFSILSPSAPRSAALATRSATAAASPARVPAATPAAGTGVILTGAAAQMGRVARGMILIDAGAQDLNALTTRPYAI